MYNNMVTRYVTYSSNNKQKNPGIKVLSLPVFCQHFRFCVNTLIWFKVT